MAVCSSLIRSQVPEGVRGRVYTLMDLTWSLMRPVSLGMGGLVDTVGIQVVYYAGGTMLALAGLLGGYAFQGEKKAGRESSPSYCYFGAPDFDAIAPPVS